MSKTAILLINLGTPDDPSTPAVKRYLREFLMDPYVLDYNWLKRWTLVNCFILPKRPAESAKAYQVIWNERGSPLMYHTQDLNQKVKALAGERYIVDFAMRYGTPSIPSVMEKLAKQDVTKLLVLPLYPQYSLAANESSIHEVKKYATQFGLRPRFLRDFYQNNAYFERCCNCK